MGKGSDPAAIHALFSATKKHILGGDAQVAIGLTFSPFQESCIQQADNISRGAFAGYRPWPIGKITGPTEQGEQFLPQPCLGDHHIFEHLAITGRSTEPGKIDQTSQHSGSKGLLLLKTPHRPCLLHQIR